MMYESRFGEMNLKRLIFLSFFIMQNPNSAKMSSNNLKQRKNEQ